MKDHEKPAFLRVYRMPYDQLRVMSLEELEKLCKEVTEESRKATLTQRWLEGILRRRRSQAASET